jgi:uncharacterized RDD family membrane protein YckC
MVRQYNRPLRLKRTFAFILDLIIVDMLIIFPFKDIFNKLFLDPFDMINDAPILSKVIGVYGFISVFIIAYFVILEYYTGQTLGKLMMDLKTVSLQNKGLSLVQAILRSLYFIPVFPFNLFIFIDLAMFYYNGKRLLELFSKTKVIEVKR